MKKFSDNWNKFIIDIDTDKRKLLILRSFLSFALLFIVCMHINKAQGLAIDYADEMGNWSLTKILCGQDWSDFLPQDGYISYLYSLLLVPITLLPIGAVNIYRMAILINAIMIVISYISISGSIVKLYPNNSKLILNIASAVAVGSSAIIYYSRFSNGEILFFMLFILTLSAGIRYLDSPKMMNICIFLGTAMLNVAANPRNIIILIAAESMIVYLDHKDKKKIVFSFAFILIASTVLWVPYWLINQKLNLYEVTAINDIGKLFSNAIWTNTNNSLIGSILIGILGRLFYIGISSYLFVYVGIIAMIVLISNYYGKRVTEDVKIYLPFEIKNITFDVKYVPILFFMLFSLIGMILLSTVQYGGVNGNIANLYHGCYLEGLIVPIVIIGIVETIYNLNIKPWKYKEIFIIFGIIGVALYAYMITKGIGKGEISYSIASLGCLIKISKTPSVFATLDAGVQASIYHIIVLLCILTRYDENEDIGKDKAKNPTIVIRNAAILGLVVLCFLWVDGAYTYMRTGANSEETLKKQWAASEIADLLEHADNESKVLLVYGENSRAVAPIKFLTDSDANLVPVNRFIDEALADDTWFEKYDKVLVDDGAYNYNTEESVNIDQVMNNGFIYISDRIDDYAGLMEDENVPEKAEMVQNGAVIEYVSADIYIDAINSGIYDTKEDITLANNFGTVGEVDTFVIPKEDIEDNNDDIDDEDELNSEETDENDSEEEVCLGYEMYPGSIIFGPYANLMSGRHRIMYSIECVSIEGEHDGSEIAFSLNIANELGTNEFAVRNVTYGELIPGEKVDYEFMVDLYENEYFVEFLVRNNDCRLKVMDIICDNHASLIPAFGTNSYDYENMVIVADKGNGGILNILCPKGREKIIDMRSIREVFEQRGYEINIVSEFDDSFEDAFWLIPTANVDLKIDMLPEYTITAIDNEYTLMVRNDSGIPEAMRGDRRELYSEGDTVSLYALQKVKTDKMEMAAKLPAGDYDIEVCLNNPTKESESESVSGYLGDLNININANENSEDTNRYGINDKLNINSSDLKKKGAFNTYHIESGEDIDLSIKLDKYSDIYNQLKDTEKDNQIIIYAMNHNKNVDQIKNRILENDIDDELQKILDRYDGRMESEEFEVEVWITALNGWSNQNSVLR